MNLRVETFLGEAGMELIGRFYLGENCLEVIENMDQWYGERYRYFKVKADDRNLYILPFDEASAEWDLTMFKTQPAAPLSKVFHKQR